MLKNYSIMLLLLVSLIGAVPLAANPKLASSMALTVSGKVLDETGQPVPGVNILEKGTTNGTTSDADGAYKISVEGENSVLVFTFIGYAAQEITVGTQNTIDVSLVPDITSLDEIVVTALGIKKESKKLGYAVTSVKPQEMIENRTNNMMESLVGRVAGLNISAPAAGAGASTQIRLRGQVGFAGGNNAPLIVLNGLPMNQGANSADGPQMRDRGDNLLNINPDDIENMTILKGSSAAAIYGSRAAAGAILITTKSGAKNQGLGVEITSSYTSQQPLDFMTDNLQTMYGAGAGGVKPINLSDASNNAVFGWGALLDGSDAMIFNGEMVPYKAYKNGLMDYLRNGSNFTNTVAFSNGGEKGSFRLSVSNTDAKGLDPKNEYKRKVVNLGANQNLTPKLNLAVNVNYTNEDQINPPQVGQQSAGATNFYWRLANSIPADRYYTSAVETNGTERKTNNFQGTVTNPNYLFYVPQQYIATRNRVLGTGTLRYNFTDWLYAQGRFNYDFGTTFTTDQVPGGIATNDPFRTDGTGTYAGSYNVSESRGTEINADFIVGANKQFGKISTDVSFGGNTYRTNGSNFFNNGTNFILRDFFSQNNATARTTGYSVSKSRINSLYGIAEIGYNGMVFVNFTGRSDWFSVISPLAKNNQFYPSVTGSFIFSEVLPNLSWLSYGKLRSSWSQTSSTNGLGSYEGNLNYGFSSNLFNGTPLMTVSGNQSPNQYLVPFKATETSIGAELRMFNNKLVVDIDAYQKITRKQILPLKFSQTSGYDNQKENVAELSNKGIEVQVSYTVLKNSNLTWTTSWNNAFLATKVLKISDDLDDFLLIDWWGGGSTNEFIGQLHYTKGLAMNQIYTRTYLRNANGDMVVDNNGQFIQSGSYVPMGSSIPKWTGGWTNSVSYKKFTLGVLIDYKFGGVVLSGTALNGLRQGHSKASLVGRREGETGIIWPGVNQTTGLPNTVNVTNLQGFYTNYRAQQIGDPFIFATDFIKLRNISLAYDFSGLIEKSGLSKVVKGASLSASCRNVAILYKDIPGLDPEGFASSGDSRAGYESYAMPTTRNYNLTLNVKF